MPTSRHLLALTAAAVGGYLISALVPLGAADADRRRDQSCVATERDLADYQAANAELERGLDRVSQLADSRRPLDGRDQRQIVAAARDARRRAARLVRGGDARWGHGHGRDRDRDHRDREIVSADDFVRLDAAMAEARFDKDRVALAQRARAGRFSAAQVAGLMRRCSFDDSRIEVAVALAGRLVDPEAWFEIDGALEFESSREALGARLTRRDPDPAAY